MRWIQKRGVYTIKSVADGWVSTWREEQAAHDGVGERAMVVITEAVAAMIAEKINDSIAGYVISFGTGVVFFAVMTRLRAEALLRVPGEPRRYPLPPPALPTAPAA